VPGAGPLGEIVGGLGLGTWGTAAEFHRIKRKKAAGKRSWLDIVVSIIQKLLVVFRKSK
jgi:hypothetical protein